MLTLLLALALDAQTPVKDEAQITAAQDARFAAMVKGDAAYLETALAPSLTYHHSSGSAQTKTEFMAAIRAGALKYKALDIVERKVRRIGAIARSTGMGRSDGLWMSDTHSGPGRCRRSFEMPVLL